jgi:methylmalonyl-CoA/ethylmalonyl-CoA epimerase
MLPQMRFHHIGVACKDIEKAVAQYEKGGYVKSDVVFDPIQNINICFLTSTLNPTIELLSPVNEKSPVVQILKKNGTIPYHVCYSVPNIEVAVKELVSQRYMQVSPINPACALHDKCVCFMFHKDVGLIELLQE